MNPSALILLALALAGLIGVFASIVLWTYIMLMIVKRRLIPGSSLRAIAVYGLVSITSFLVSGVCAHLLDPDSEPWFVSYVFIGFFFTVGLAFQLWVFVRQCAPRQQ